MPAMGFGTYGITTAQVFYDAIKNGFRHFDTASFYDNEEVIGEAVKRAIEDSIVTRSELFIVTKIWHTEFADVDAAIQRSLHKLQTPYVDLYLIHWPLNGPMGIPMHKLWPQMEAQVHKGLARSIGVSNFSI